MEEELAKRAWKLCADSEEGPETDAARGSN